MKRLLFIFSLLCGFVPNMSMAQSTKTVNLTYSAEDFTLVSSGRGMNIHSQKYLLSCGSDTLTPAIPTISVTVPLDEGMDFNGFEYTTSSQLLLQENVVLNANKLLRPTSIMDEPEERNISYPMGIYPNENVRQTGTYVLRGQKFVCFLVSPFRYDAYSKNLYLIASITLQIQQKEGLRRDGEWHRSNNRSQNNTNTIDYEYVIITNDTLKPAFQRLANWKNTKGIRTKILTKEGIDSVYNDNTLQIKIKHAIYDLYNSQNQKLHYILLGGDVDIVPSQQSYFGYGSSVDTPSDWFYGCFDTMNWDNNGNGIAGETSDSIDLAAEVIVSRLSVQTLEQAMIMVDRIIEYEKEPILNGWENNILMSGACLYNSRTGEDGHIYTDSYDYGEELFSESIQPYWNGHRTRFYDTFHDIEGITGYYRLNAENLNNEISKGYSLIHVDTHGGSTCWRMAYYYGGHFYTNNNADTLNCPRYSVITTSACSTNAFDSLHVCLSEAFMRNPNSGILVYMGCSREGFIGSSFEYNKKFYYHLLTSSDKRPGQAFYEMKKSFVGNSFNNNSYRKLLLGINLLGDPEMPLFLSTPLFFHGVSISYQNNGISINTGVPGCKVCMMSTEDMGNSYYEIQDSVSSAFFSNIPDECSICITKAGYIPYLAIFNKIKYIQNETFDTDITINAGQTFIGSDVTPQKPQGPVILEHGKLTINCPQVIIKNSFEVKKGAEFEIYVNN